MGYNLVFIEYERRFYNRQWFVLYHEESSKSQSQAYVASGGLDE